jgi:hypothetical protein
MKLAIFSESVVDETAIRVLADAILGETSSPVQSAPRSLPKGWPSVYELLPTVIRHLHYQTDADALVVVADSDNSPVHKLAHAVQQVVDCRYCQLVAKAEETTQRLAAVAGRAPLRIAVAVPTPSIDAWLRFARDGQCNEAAWLVEQARGVSSYSTVRNMKQAVFGGSRSMQRLAEIAEQEAKEAAKRLTELQQNFPNSFGVLAECIRHWPRAPSIGSGS